MLKPLNKKYPFNDNLVRNIKSIISIGLGLFMFLLFFQILDPQNPDFNKKILVLAGFGGITMILLSLMRIIVPSFFTRFFHPEKWTIGKEVMIDLIYLALHSVAYSFYARYVGKIPVTFHISVVIVFISIASLTILLVINEIRFLKNQISGETDKDIITDREDEPRDNWIEFTAENGSDRLKILSDQIILIKSANNYIEIIYKKEGVTSKKLIRNTMKKTEVQLSDYPFLIRCHRSFIINTGFVTNVQKGSDGLKLVIEDYPEKIYVSRQYSLKVREVLKKVN